MIIDKTVIISCAGMGNRLGAGIPKALVEVCGKPLIIKTLEMLRNVKDVRVVVGFQAQKVVDVVKNFRKDVTIVHNENYMNTGAAASVSLAMENTKEKVLIMVGDIIIHPEDMEKIINMDEEFVCGTTICSEMPIKLTMQRDSVVSIDREFGDYEWVGVCCLNASEVITGTKNIYQMVKPLLPKPFLYIRTKEIDTPEDLRNASEWVKNNYESI